MKFIKKMKVVLLLIKLHLIEFFDMIYLNFDFFKEEKIEIGNKKNYVEKDKVLNLVLWFNIFGILSVHLSFKVVLANLEKVKVKFSHSDWLV